MSQEDLTEEIEVEVENEFDSYVVNVNFILELILEFLSIAEQKKNYQTIVEFVNRIVESCFKWLTYLIQIQVSADECKLNFENSSPKFSNDLGEKKNLCNLKLNQISLNSPNNCHCR